MTAVKILIISSIAIATIIGIVVGVTEEIFQNINSPQNNASSGPPYSHVVEVCDGAYPGICIPPSSDDLDCTDISYENFRVSPPDPHGFDEDNNGIGCESS